MFYATNEDQSYEHRKRIPTNWSIGAINRLRLIRSAVNVVVKVHHRSKTNNSSFLLTLKRWAEVSKSTIWNHKRPKTNSKKLINIWNLQ